MKLIVHYKEIIKYYGKIQIYVFPTAFFIVMKN